MTRTRSLVGAVILTTTAALTLSAQQQQELPRFASSVEVTSLDVSVFDGQGKPVTDLKADDFIVRVDNTPRPVVSADWIQLQTAGRPAPITVPEGYSSNENASAGRLILFVVDQPNIRFGGTAGIRKAVNGFIDRLQPSDRTAVIGLGVGAPSSSFTADRARLKKTIDRLVGQYTPRGIMLHNVHVAEALEIARGDQTTLSQVVARECVDSLGHPLGEPELSFCVSELQSEGRDIARSGSIDGRDAIRALRGMLTALKSIDGPKTMIFVSEGFIVDDMQRDVAELGTIAAAARTSIYALKLDDSLFQFSESEARRSGSGRELVSRMDDRAVRAEGMEILVGASRGALINVIGNGVNAFQRIESELAGYYLIGVESSGRDKDGKAHPIAVSAKRPGLTVRTRRALIVSGAAENRAPASPREAVVAALTSPLPVAALPIRVATYSLQGPERGRVQLLIHADVGSDYASSRVVSLGYVITDVEGRMVDSQAATARLPLLMNGVPSALQYSGGASLPPGEYLLKLAVAEGDRVGTVEHAIHAGTTPAGSVRLSDLMVGGPASTGQPLLQPTVGYAVVFGAVHGYIEAYGDGSSAVTARYEVAPTKDGAALLDADVPGYSAGEGRRIFTQMLSVRQLPPGKYYLRSKLQSGGATIKTLSSAFEIAAPAVLMSSATTVPASIQREVYLPVTETMLSVPFDAQVALRPETIASFRQRISAPQQVAFDRGVLALGGKSYGDAEASFKGAVSTDADSAAALAYLAATFAASGHDLEAAGAWQTALVDGSDLPEIYDWLAGALMRNRDLGLARSVLEEAVGKWPSDPRFAKPIALVYATFGQGREAVRSLERYLAQHPEDTESIMMGVEWIYQLRSAGAVAHSPDADLALARKYAAAYIDARGPQTPLVKQWMEFLERTPQK